MSTPPSWLWARSGGSAANDYAGLDYGSSTIATDLNGNSYITGVVGKPATFGFLQTGGAASDYPKVFVAKYDPQGNALWVHVFGGDNPAHDVYGNKGESIAIDQLGNCYVTGTFLGSNNSTVSVGTGITLTGTGARQIFVVKYSPTGVALWAKQPTYAASVTAPINNYAKSIAADATGCYITGYLGAAGVVFGGTQFFGTGAYVVKCDSHGNFQWGAKLGNTHPGSADAGDTDGMCIDVRPGGNCYVSGYFQGKQVYGPSTTLTSFGTRDVFLAAVGPTGVVYWVKQFGKPMSESYGRGISVAPNGYIYLTGDFKNGINFGSNHLVVGVAQQETFVVQFDPAGGVGWAKQTQGTQNVQGNSIKASPNGETCYVTGQYSGGPVNFFGNPLSSMGSQRIFVVKIQNAGSGAGNGIWAQDSGPYPINTPSGGETAMGISLDGAYHVYVAGNAQGQARFGPNTVPAYGGYDAVIAKLDKG